MFDVQHTVDLNSRTGGLHEGHRHALAHREGPHDVNQTRGSPERPDRAPEVTGQAHSVHTASWLSLNLSPQPPSEDAQEGQVSPRLWAVPHQPHDLVASHLALSRSRQFQLRDRVHQVCSTGPVTLLNSLLQAP